MIAYPPPHKTAKAAPSGADHAGLMIERLTYVAADRQIIGVVDLHLPRTGITVLMGPNGAGKSIILKLMHGLLSPTTGRVCWNGLPVTPQMRRSQALVFQKPVLLRRSVAANLDFVLKARGRPDPARREALLSEVGLGHLGAQPARRLSGGEQQRLALARALALEPEILFLDEPTASLDPASVQMIEDIVRRVSDAGTKVVFVTHDVGQARRLADDIVFLHHGNLAEHSAAMTFFEAPVSKAARNYLQGRIVI